MKRLALLVLLTACSESPLAPKPLKPADTANAVHYVAVCTGQAVYQPMLDNKQGNFYFLNSGEEIVDTVTPGPHRVGYTIWGGPGGVSMTDTLTVNGPTLYKMDCSVLDN